MAKLEYRIQLKDAVLGTSIIAAGGKCHVSTAGSPDKATLYDKDGAALANPITPTRGFLNFFVDETVLSVDLYIMAPGGQFVERYGVAASGPNEILVDTGNKRQMMKIPFSHVDDAGDATETDTGFDVPAKAVLLDRLHGMGLDVTAADATETIDFGILSSETGGDANGLIAASSVGTAGLVIGTNGALFSSNAPHLSDAVTGKSLSYTLTAGTDTAKGFILQPYNLV